MNEITGANFDRIVQLMTFWSEQWQAHILQHGEVLKEEEIENAVCVGVKMPEKVRVLRVPNIPMPDYPLLQTSLIQSQVFDLEANGLTLGYGIFIRSDSFPQHYWITHELVHVGQYERMGGLMPCLKQYLGECLTDGYLESKLEQEAHQKALKCLNLSESVFTFGDKIEPPQKD